MAPDYETPTQVCPNCEAVICEAFLVQGDRSPQPGDICVCAYCAAVCSFDSELRLRVLSPEEIALLPDETKLTLEQVTRPPHG